MTVTWRVITTRIITRSILHPGIIFTVSNNNSNRPLLRHSLNALLQDHFLYRQVRTYFFYNNVPKSYASLVLLFSRRTHSAIKKTKGTWPLKKGKILAKIPVQLLKHAPTHTDLTAQVPLSFGQVAKKGGGCRRRLLFVSLCAFYDRRRILMRLTVHSPWL